MSGKCKVCFHNINARNAKAQCTDAKPIFMRVVLIWLKIMWNFYSHKVKSGDAMIVKGKKWESLRLKSAINAQGASN